MRGRVFRNYCEGHMDKTGGGREWLGENADNCN